MTVKLPYDPVWEPLTWAKKHCPSYITNSADVDGGIIYYFGNQDDAVLFKLAWA